jgi:phosphatidylethanolamine-binding protein (PEBP) family uncharacterized protein
VEHGPRATTKAPQLLPRRIPRRSLGCAVAVVVSGLLAAACSTDDGRTLRPPRPDQNDSVATTTLAPTSDPSFVDNSDPSAFVVTGPWADGSRIADRYTCEAGDVSPPIAFGNLPAGTVALGLVLYPTMSPDRILWAMANIDTASPFVPEGQVPAGAAVAAATDGNLGYSGPCPPDTAGSFTLVAFALGQVVDVLEGDPADEALAVMQLAAIDIDTTTFTYGP